MNETTVIGVHAAKVNRNWQTLHEIDEHGVSTGRVEAQRSRNIGKHVLNMRSSNIASNLSSSKFSTIRSELEFENFVCLAMRVDWNWRVIGIDPWEGSMIE